MELKHTASRDGRLSSFLKEEMAMSTGLINRLKWQERLFVNDTACHTDYPVKTGDVIRVVMDEPEPEYTAEEVRASAARDADFRALAEETLALLRQRHPDRMS